MAATLLGQFCNLFGGSQGAGKLLGGLSNKKPTVQWYCKNRSVGRFYMECAHGHRGQIMEPCQSHLNQFHHAVKFCPRCNSEPPGHQCKLVIRPLS